MRKTSADLIEPTAKQEQPNSASGLRSGLHERHGASLDLVLLLRHFRTRWKWLALGALAPLSLTLLITQFAMQPKWQAVATLRPVNKQMQLSQLTGLLPGSLFGAGMGSLGSMLGMSQQSDEADEYMTILKSYDFTVKIAHQHHLTDYLGTPGKSWVDWLTGQPDVDRDWACYKAMQKRFSCDFDLDTGNLELSVIDYNPAMARRILSWYIEGLRENLRAEEIRDSKSALKALRTEAATTEDAYLQAQLYQLAALQLQNAKLAEAESDYAFKEVQSPVVGGTPYSPRPLRYAAVAGLCGEVSAILWILVIASASPGAAADAPRKGSAAEERHDDESVPVELTTNGLRRSQE